jgi:flavin reductase (DIM6/NTAB) family NADH-FMN oxidoreductase RutF
MTTPDRYRDVIGRFATGVTIVTAQAEHGPCGTTANALTSLSVEPPTLLLCLNRESATGRVVAEVGAFAINILADGQGELARRFATKGSDKFSGVSVAAGELGQPLLEDALAHLECRVTEQVAGGTHVVFIARVEHASARPGAPLAYFRGRFGRLEEVAC